MIAGSGRCASRSNPDSASATRMKAPNWSPPIAPRAAPSGALRCSSPREVAAEDPDRPRQRQVGDLVHTEHQPRDRAEHARDHVGHDDLHRRRARGEKRRQRHLGGEPTRYPHLHGDCRASLAGDARGLQSGPARSGASTPSRPTGRSSRRWSARAAAGRASRCSALGAYTGDTETRELARQANENAPVLRTHDRYGNRIDEVEFHPAWHELMGLAVEHETPLLRLATDPEPGAHVARAALMMLCQAEAGLGCPISMTYAVDPGAAQAAGARGGVGAAADAPAYDRRFMPAPEKAGALAGMGMTEKQGGSDVRANTTTARPVNGGGPGREYELTGHKWFCSAPMCDAFLVLAQAEGGLSCFLLPRFTPDGERNRVPHPAPQGQARQPLQRRRARSSSTAPGRRWSARRAAASRRSSRWSTTRAWTAWLGSASRHARTPSSRRPSTPPTARPSASCSPTSR